MAENKISWSFPSRKISFMKLETFTVIILAIFVFFYSFLQADQRWFHAVIAVVAFIALYVLISFIIQKVRRVEEKYVLNHQHLEVTRKTKTKITKERVHLKDIKHHKLDKFFLGGYVMTHGGDRHALFFNTRRELERFENFLKKKLGLAKKSATAVKKVTRKVKTVKKKSVKKTKARKTKRR